MKNVFSKVRVSHLYSLCNILAGAQVIDFGNIKRKYQENALSFDETLSFLEHLGIVKNKNTKLFITTSLTYRDTSIQEFKSNFLQILFLADGELSEQLREYLLNFEVKSGKIFFKASEFEKIKYSDIRDLLLDLEFLALDSDETTFVISPEHTELLVNYLESKKFSPKSLKRKQIENDLIGLAAEKAIIDFELNRLTAIYLNPEEIKHVSQENAAAGYDIKSFENYLDHKAKKVRRYIEVKAVSIQDYKFYFSRIELEISKVYAERYYLYLLPVISNDNFDFEKLVIINNPFKNIYLNNLEWKKQVESISFSRSIDD